MSYLKILVVDDDAVTRTLLAKRLSGEEYSVDTAETGVDAIVIAPGDSLELIPVLKKARDAGIEVINIDINHRVRMFVNLRDDHPFLGNFIK